MSEFNINADQRIEREHRSHGRYMAKQPSRKKRKNNRKKATILVASIIAVVLLVVIVCALLPKTDSELIGVWQYNEYTKYEFFEDGKGCLCADDVHYEYEYKISNGTLKLDFVEDVVRDCDYSYSIDGKKLTLTGGEGTDGGTYELNKVSQQNGKEDKNE